MAPEEPIKSLTDTGFTMPMTQSLQDFKEVPFYSFLYFKVHKNHFWIVGTNNFHHFFRS